MIHGFGLSPLLKQVNRPINNIAENIFQKKSNNTWIFEKLLYIDYCTLTERLIFVIPCNKIMAIKLYKNAKSFKFRFFRNGKKTD